MWMLGAVLTVQPRNRFEIVFCIFCISDRIPDCGPPLVKDSILEPLDQQMDVVLGVEAKSRNQNSVAATQKSKYVLLMQSKGFCIRHAPYITCQFFD